MTTVVFGASGNVGKYVAAGLDSAGVRVRRTSRDPGAAGFPSGVEVVAADLERPETVSAALEGARRVFLYAKPDGIEGFVAAAESAGVRQVVLLSSAAVVMGDAALSPIGVAHAVVESAIQKSGMDWTFIRPGMFATNALWWWQKSIREEGVVRLPYPDALTTPVHEKDLAALAVAALTEPGHEGRAYSVTGPEALTLRQQVRHIGEAVDRDIAVDSTTVDQARAELLKTLPPFAVDGILAGWKAGIGVPAPVPTGVAEIIGRPAHTFAQWAIDHASDFR
ncbi:SDR family oxidoreductase [Nocardia bovistercoris]|uniref:NAD(P)H-binding protein n=1 Tax=Nocardia bovistercoris TaxID=2785916 RepID=A0A931N276_9NOCA|nr:NAD(P)H-binding protein [Nocardia bovistercoris]MBH0776629.1 NAD(P)H-binding protein [Nocardia bovistercoris]